MSGDDPKKIPELKNSQADLIIGILLIIVNIWVAYESVHMSIVIYQKTGGTIYTVPGLFPFIVSVILIICALRVITRAVASGATLKSFSIEQFKNTLKDRDSYTMIIVIAWMAIFVLILIRIMPFEIATAGFILFLLLMFRATSLWKAILISIVYASAVVFFFARVVGTRFPMSFF
jgi:hypothetical protein